MSASNFGFNFTHPKFFEVLFIFIIGTVYEVLCVGFVRYTESNQINKAIAVTMGAGTLQLLGLFEATHNLILAISLILGYGFGVFLALKTRD